MHPLQVVETFPGKYSLFFEAGSTPVDGAVRALGHEPHGYFWAVLARLLVGMEAPDLEGRFSYDPEAGTFCAYGTDRGALEALAKLLTPFVTDVEQATKAVGVAVAKGVDLDD